MEYRDIRMVRVPQAIVLLGEKKSSFYAKVIAGLMPRPIKIGAKAAALPDYEIRAVNTARIRGVSDEELRALVADLHEARKTAS
jgi:prophage regulatory protein